MTQLQLTREQVSVHHTTSSTWVIVNEKVYDITEFLEGHPGGEEILLQYGGKDITKVLQDEDQHLHSDVAYQMLEEYCIGYLEDSDTKPTEKKDTFIDVTKPMLLQVWNGNFTKDVYVKQVHIPRHTKNSPPIFGGPLELLSKTPWVIWCN